MREAGESFSADRIVPSFIDVIESPAGEDAAPQLAASTPGREPGLS
jgi:hypothetical protein